MTLATVASIEVMAQRGLSDPETVQASYAIAKAAIEAGIPGDFVECGVFAGTQAAAMARAIMENPGCGKRVHLFDSFAGLPDPGPKDQEFTGVWKLGDMACTIQQVQQHMREWRIEPAVLVYHPGWFEDTLPGDVGSIAVLRLDGDLYESTKLCMERMFPKLSKGGWCIVDDFGLTGCRAAVLESLPTGVSMPIYFQGH